MASFAVDDDPDLDDAALWAVIDSAAAAASRTTSHTRQPLTTLKRPNPQPSPYVVLPPSPSPPPSHQQLHQNHLHYSINNNNTSARAQKVARTEMSESNSPDMVVVKRVNNTTPEVGRLSVSPFLTPEVGKFSVSPFAENRTPMTEYQEKENFTHCLSGRFPTVSLFKDYQEAALAILEKSDYTMISGNPFIKKSGWRKIAFYFNISFEIRDKTIEFDNNRDVQRAEFVVRAHMQGGRFSDGWGSCERREKRFNKPNNDIPSTAETRAKNKACQDLVGIGAYRSGAGQSNWSR